MMLLLMVSHCYHLYIPFNLLSKAQVCKYRLHTRMPHHHETGLHELFPQDFLGFLSLISSE